MPQRKIALIGHSGSGKSTCLERLGIDSDRADMDRSGLPWPPLIKDFLGWMNKNAEPVIAVSVHMDQLAELAERKSAGETFPDLFFVYLRYSRSMLEEHLRREDACGKKRSDGNIKSALKDYEYLDMIFQKLADYTIRDMEMSEVIEEIRHCHNLIAA